MTRRSWWRRNRLWLALLVPLLVVALGASSFRLATLYLPWEWSRPTVAEGSSGVLRQTYVELDGETRDREVRVSVVAVTPHTTLGDARAVDGAVLWNVELELSAAPDQFLSGCEVEVQDADGDRYDFRSGLGPAEEGGMFLPPVLVLCVPEDAPGPTVEPLTGELIPSPVERPGSWRQEVLIAIPEGVEPDAVRIGWHQPEYLVLDVP